MSDAGGNRKISIGKVTFFVGIAGIGISLLLVSVGVLLSHGIDNPDYMWLSIAGTIGIPVCFIVAVAGAISWYLEPYVARTRAGRRKDNNPQSQ